MIVIIILTVYFTLSYVAGWTAFMSNSRGKGCDWIMWAASPVVIPIYILMLGVSILVTRR